MGIVTWATMRCEILPSLEEAFLVGSPDLDVLLEMAYWLIRLRMVNECFILNNTNVATIFAKDWPKGYDKLREALPQWILFYVVAGYEYLPEERVSAYLKDITEITQRLGVEPTKAVGGVSANEILKAVQQPSGEPYWKLRPKGACQDIFFLTLFDKLATQIGGMNELVEKSGYSAVDLGVYIQPIVQGTSYHCEFNLFYDPENQSEQGRVKNLSALSTKSLIAMGAYFSRPYGENAEMIFNRDAASVSALSKLKDIIDPNHIMNPGKVCF